MLNQIKNSGRFPLTFLLAAMSVFCFSLSIFRYNISDSPLFLFLNWNLFLSFIPFAISSYLVLRKKRNILSVFILIATWLLFFPNSPYILTDLFHLKQRLPIPIWFDLVVVMSFAWTGLMFGLISLMDIERILRETISRKLVNIIITVFLFAGSFGIYLGRYLRWNSWDIIQDPHGLMSDVADRFINPFNHPRTWAMTILYGILLNMFYWTVKLVSKSKTFESENISQISYPKM
jgi:uncharacterized membrane protein